MDFIICQINVLPPIFYVDMGDKISQNLVSPSNDYRYIWVGDEPLGTISVFLKDS